MVAVKKALAILPWLLPLAWTIQPPRQPYQPVGTGEDLLTFNQTSPSATITPASTTFNWVDAGSDGLYLITGSNGDVRLGNIVTGKSNLFVEAKILPNDTEEYWVNYDASLLLIAANTTKQYRHSYFADYFIVDVESKVMKPLVDDQVGDIQYAEFAPAGDKIAFVRANNLFILDFSSGDVDQITNDGGPDMFHAVPDWVYEEEIFGSRSSFWFSPDAEYIAFLSFNETGVKTFTVPYYMDDQKLAPTYPKELELRYPKVGSTNPTVQLNVLNISSGEYDMVPVDVYEPENLIIGEVAWVTDTHTALIYRAFNRVQDKDKHVVVDPVSLSSEVVRERDGTDGWLDNNLAISYIGKLKNGTDAAYYVDLSDQDGWNHIYLYPVGKGAATQLTKGEWEVTSILSVDTAEGFVYFQAAKSHSTERHIYKVSLSTKKITPLVHEKIPAYWSASFSSGGKYYVLSYRGPDVPYQEVYATNSTGLPIRTVEDNKDFYETLAEYKLPNITYFELEHPDGYKLNVMQQLPPNFNPKKQYPVLFTPYGGPNSQSVTKEFQTWGWATYISSDPELEYVVYTVDNRGTGLRGRKYRSTVTSQLGKLEPRDQVWAAGQLSKQFDFINPKKIGMWGWSYGGYLTAKTLEYDSGVFSFGLITAPVSDWRFYDSIYTERYMKTIEDNEDGYLETAVRNTSGFKNVAGGFSVLHGLGDDNVHYQHTAALVDLLVGEGVSPAQMKLFAFTDSDHSIDYNNANVYLYKFLTERLYDEVKRKVGEKVVHQWSRREEELD